MKNAFNHTTREQPTCSFCGQPVTPTDRLAVLIMEIRTGGPISRSMISHAVMDYGHKNCKLATSSLDSDLFPSTHGIGPEDIWQSDLDDGFFLIEATWPEIQTGFWLTTPLPERP